MVMDRDEDDSVGGGGGAGGGPGRVAVEIVDHGRLLQGPVLGVLLGHARAAVAAAAGDRGGEVRVRLVDDAAMAVAHERYSGIPGTTDVLTFDLSGGRTAGGGDLDVDILACVDEARRQAGHHGHAPERELLLYILHGVLHCLGHDDHDAGGFERMHAEEDRVLEAIGVGPVFHAPPSPAGPSVSAGGDDGAGNAGPGRAPEARR
jgi:probable rRNA maturation factor